MLQEKPPLFTDTTVPLQLIEASPDNESDAVPLTAIEDAVKIAPSAGEAITRAGGVLSRLTVTLAVAEAPTLSITVPLTT
jgi:hypothetical protein